MKDISIKINNQIRNVNIINYNVEKIFLRAIIFSFGALAIFYVLILGNMVWNIVERRSLEREVATLGSAVHELELTYLSQSMNIDLIFSKNLGFTETDTKFATRKSLGSVKLAKNEI